MQLFLCKEHRPTESDKLENDALIKWNPMACLSCYHISDKVELKTK